MTPDNIYDDGATYGPGPDADIPADHDPGGIYDDGEKYGTH